MLILWFESAFFLIINLSTLIEIKLKIINKSIKMRNLKSNKNSNSILNITQKYVGISYDDQK
jgi:hypothetical protein